MYKEIIHSAKTDLQGNTLRSFRMIFSAWFFHFFFLLYCFVTVYLLVIEPSFVAEFAVFSNPYFHGAVCLVVVLVGFVLLTFAAYRRFCRDIWFASFYKNVTFEGCTVNFSLKILSVYIVTAVKKLLYTVLFLLPSLLLGSLIYRFALSGVQTTIFVLLCTADVLIFLCGAVMSAVFLNRYALVPYFLAEDRDYTVKDIFIGSVEAMNGKCVKLFFLKIRELPRRFLSLLLLPCVYYWPLFFLARIQLATGKTNPHIRKRAHAEKTVVFYFGNSVRQS